jgi:mRNA interferase MazF
MLVISPKKFNSRTGIVIGLPMTTAVYNETNPFAVKFQGEDGKVSYVLTHQPKSFDWRLREAKIHPWKKAPDEVILSSCELLNQIIQLT